MTQLTDAAARLTAGGNISNQPSVIPLTDPLHPSLGSKKRQTMRSRMIRHLCRPFV